MGRLSLTTCIHTVGQRLWRRLHRTRHLAAPPYAGVIREAERCRSNAERAAAFRQSGGVDRLESAIAAADADGHDDWVDRGQVARRQLTDVEYPAEPINQPSEKKG